MATKAMNVKLEESRIQDIKNVAAVFHMTMTEIINGALDEYLSRMKKDPFYRLTVNVEEASAEESAEVLEAIESLSDDDLAIATVSRFEI